MKRLRGAIPLLFVLALPLCLLAAEKTAPLPKDLPPYGPLAPFHAPQVEVHKLDNGLTLWLVPRRGFPKVALVLAVRGGMARDPRDLPGLSQLLLATVDQGTRTRGAKQIAEEIQAAGGDLTGEAPADTLLVATSVLASKTDSVLALLADIFQNATFPPDEVALAKRNASDDLRAREAEPSFLANRAMAKVIFGDHPYGVLAPTQDSIAKSQPEILRGQYAERFRPDETLLVAVGDFDPDSFAAEVRHVFGKWQLPKQTAASVVSVPSQKILHDVFIVPRAGSVQTTFLLGAFAPTMRDPDFAASEVANAIYGGMFGSRLITNIREDKGYTYSPGAFLETRREAGLLLTRADVRNAVTGATLNEIEYELNRMATTLPDLEEMTHAQRYLVGLRAISLQSQESVARQLAKLWSLGLPPEELGRQSERIQKVTAREVEAAGRKYFPAAHATIVAVGDENVIRQELSPLGAAFHSVPP
jgi:predicted Zn-dependent peptidase